eukprot:3480835-Pleurochrysis_carterae.AAC.1
MPHRTPRTCNTSNAFYCTHACQKGILQPQLGQDCGSRGPDLNYGFVRFRLMIKHSEQSQRERPFEARKAAGWHATSADAVWLPESAWPSYSPPLH